MSAEKLSYLGIYTEFADAHVRRCQRQGKLHEISRINVELQLLNEVDKTDFHLKHKLRWYKRVLDTSKFNAYWTSVSKRLGLPETCTERLELKEEEEEEEVEEEEVEKPAEDVPVDVDSEESEIDGLDLRSDHDPRDHPLFSAPWPRPLPRPVKHCLRCYSTMHTTEEGEKMECGFDWADWVSDSSEGSLGRHKNKTLCKVLAVGLDRDTNEMVHDWLRRLESAHEDPCTTWTSMNPRAEVEKDDAVWEDSPYGCQCRHRRRAGAVNAAPTADKDGDDAGDVLDGKEGAYGEDGSSLSGSKAKGKAPTLATAKSAAKPKGIVKRQPKQEKKEKTPAQIKLIETAITPAQTSKGAEGSGAHVEDHVSPSQQLGQGVKRTLEETSDAGDDGPPTKKAKVGGGTSVEGGRKKAPLKRNKSKGPMK